MKHCAVLRCRKDSVRYPQLSFFGLPRDSYVRDEWIDVLSLKDRDVSQQISVCELHFKQKDFCAGRKSLKHHAVPVIRLGHGKDADPENSDDEFIPCGSDSDPEIMEVKKLSSELYASANTRKIKIKAEPADVKKPDLKEDPLPMEQDTGRRPSRRAAQEAAKKIANTVRQFNSSNEDPEPRMTSPQNTQYVTKILPSHTRGQHTPRGNARKMRQKEWHMIRSPQPDISLIMECHEELLSAPQAEALLKAQLEYNMVMKTLRALKANNARIICTLGDGSEPEKALTPPSITTSVKASPTSGPNIITLIPATPTQTSVSNNAVVPVQLSAVASSPLSPTVSEPAVQLISSKISVTSDNAAA